MSKKPSITDLKKIVSDYLKGEAIDIIELQLQKVSSNSGCNCQAYYQTITDLHPNDPYLNAIRKQLNIDKDKFVSLINKSGSLYDLLVSLSEDDHHHIQFLLKLINKTNPPHNWGLIFSLSAITSAALGLIFYFKKHYLEMVGHWVITTFPLAVRWLNRTFSVLRNISIFGIIYNTADLLAMWYHAFFNTTHNNTLKLNHLFFRTLQSGLTIAAYSLTCLAGGTLALPIASLFVLSSSMDVFKSLFMLYYSNKTLSLLPKRKQDNCSWELLAENKRAENYWDHALKSVRLKIIAAVFTTIAVCIWSFSPPSLLITVSCFSFITLISLAKKSFSEKIERQFAERLQTELKGIEQPTDPDLEPAHATILQQFKSQEDQLNRREARVAGREALVKAEKDTLHNVVQAVREGGLNVSSDKLNLFGSKRGHNRSHSQPDFSSTPQL